MSFGMMSDAYFVSKSTLIEWVNNFLQIRMEKVEECASGAYYCNIWDAIHPGTIPMAKVDFTVKYEHEYVKNWKLLQTAFEKANVAKVIPVQKLIKAKYQDNLEFLQWMYKYCHEMYNGDPNHPDYDAVDRRSSSKGGDSIGSGSSHQKSIAKKATPLHHRPMGKENVLARPPSAKLLPSHPKAPHSNNHAVSQNDEEFDVAKLRQDLEDIRRENSDLQVIQRALEDKVNTLEGEHKELTNVAKDIEKERDFYFNKVLQVESTCKANDDPNLPLIQTILNILYATDESNKVEEAADNNDGQLQP